MFNCIIYYNEQWYTCEMHLPGMSLMFCVGCASLWKDNGVMFIIRCQCIPLERIARYFPIPSRMEQKIWQGSPFRGVAGGIIGAISRPYWTQNGKDGPNSIFFFFCDGVRPRLCATAAANWSISFDWYNANVVIFAQQRNQTSRLDEVCQ